MGQLILCWALIQRGLGTGRQKIQIKYSHLFLLFRKDGKLQLSQSKRRLRSKEKWPESRRSFRNNEKNSFVNSEPFQCVEYIGQNVVSTDVSKWLLLRLISGSVFRPLTASGSWHFQNWHSQATLVCGRGLPWYQICFFHFASKRYLGNYLCLLSL